MAINLTTEFKGLVDEVNKNESKRSLLTNDDYDWSGAHSIKIYKVSTAAMNDYDRSGTGSNASRYGAVASLDATTEEMTLSQDRSFTFAIDKLDEDETKGALAGATALSRQQREKIIPEIDAYVYNKMATNAGNKVTGTWAETTSLYSCICAATEIMDDAEISDTGRVLLLTPTGYRLLKADSTVTVSESIADNLRQKGVVGMLDGMSIIKVPSNRLPAGTIFMIAHPSSTCGPVKLQNYVIHEDAPGISGSLVEGRICYDAFVLDNQKAGIFLYKTLGPAITIASAAGSTSGTTKITVTSHTLKTGHKYLYKTAASVDTPLYGETLTTTGTGAWTEWDGSSDITATTGNVIVIADVDSSSKCAAAGTATVTSKA